MCFSVLPIFHALNLFRKVKHELRCSCKEYLIFLIPITSNSFDLFPSLVWLYTRYWQLATSCVLIDFQLSNKERKKPNTFHPVISHGEARINFFLLLQKSWHKKNYNLCLVCILYPCFDTNLPTEIPTNFSRFNVRVVPRMAHSFCSCSSFQCFLLIKIFNSHGKKIGMEKNAKWIIAVQNFDFHLLIMPCDNVHCLKVISNFDWMESLVAIEHLSLNSVPSTINNKIHKR